MSRLPRSLLWPLARLGEGIERVAELAGLAPTRGESKAGGAIDIDSTLELGRYVGAKASTLGLQAETLDGTAGITFERLRHSLPAVVRTRGDDGALGFLCISARKGSRFAVLTPSGDRMHLDEDALLDALTEPLFPDALADTERLVEEAGVAIKKRKAVCRALLHERRAYSWLEAVWSFRPAASQTPTRLARQAGLGKKLVGLALAQALQSALWILSWWIVGKAALEGRIESGWLTAWVLLLATMIPVRLWSSWTRGMIALVAGGLLKRRLLYGALRTDPDAIRAQGAGRLLGRVNESEALESLALSGGLQSLLASVELVAAAIVLALGASGLWHVALLVFWLGVVLAGNHSLFRALQSWSQGRLQMTDDLVENMVGHRTRLIQEAADARHLHDDREIEDYEKLSCNLDRRRVALQALIPRGWLALGSLGVVVPFVRGPASLSAIAVSAGGMLLAHRALSALSAGLYSLGQARISWQAIRELSTAASKPVETPAIVGSLKPGEGKTLFELSDVHYQHQGRPQPTLEGCSLQIKRGDQLLLQGESGAGKSTLAALVAGLRKPSSGLVLARGLDLHTLGEDGWKRRVASAPQFHDNYIFTGSLLFNIAMSRRWPASNTESAQIEEICYELGLGSLIERMPGGLNQMVGESGWQLSHGEKSRVFIARALFQDADLIILDESLAALDPETLRQCLACIRRRSPSLMVIAHP